ncbi:hypothetical protein B0H14DRAFT_3909987 [Mycena olivaceomarginata]|nr:hypothetical protein B0H14DRAFT_3909987 [Mycena olivaceomarginata]
MNDFPFWAAQLRELWERQERQERQERRERLEGLEWQEWLEWRERRERLERQERQELRERQERLEQRELQELRELRDQLEPPEQLVRVERLARLERERLQLEQQEQDRWHRQDRLEGRERKERKERQERKEQAREQQRQERERRAQLLQQLRLHLEPALAGSHSTISPLSVMFLLVLSALALALVGWFIFLGLLLTILAYLLLVIMPASPQTVELCSTPGVPGRDATFIRGTRSAGALAAFLPHVAVLAANERIHRVASLATRCMDSGRNPASYGFPRLFRTRF